VIWTIRVLQLVGWLHVNAAITAVLCLLTFAASISEAIVGGPHMEYWLGWAWVFMAATVLLIAARIGLCKWGIARNEKKLAENEKKIAEMSAAVKSTLPDGPKI